jgi:K(+)-stimulated pyrophosphate-energized sodium pump
MNNAWIYLSLGLSLVALLLAFIVAKGIKKNSQGNDRMKEISKDIFDGAMAFLNQEYQSLLKFILIVTFILFALSVLTPMVWQTAVSFVIGAALSVLAGNVGMRIATSSNARAAHAVTQDSNKGLRIAFSSGAVMGLCVVGLGLIGVSGLYLLFKDPAVLFGFGFGASSIALFARVGGGIYTKSADVGADLVGKVEAGIPEDDPRNPAVIADNVGDNVGDVAGMGSDLFESYVDSIIAAMVLGTVVTFTTTGVDYVQLPILIAGIGIFSSIIGIFIVLGTKGGDPAKTMNKGVNGAAILMLALSGIAIWYMGAPVQIFYALMSGLVAGIVIGQATEYFTSDAHKPTQKLASSAKTSAATGIINGLALGMMSTVIPIIAVIGAISFSYYFVGLYGIAIASVGMLSTLGITLAIDTYGPVADNAAGIAEMAGLGKEARERAEALDAVGNTTAAIGKGFAIGSAGLTALALFSAYSQEVTKAIGGTLVIAITDPEVMVGLFIGALMPYIFSSLTMSAVGNAAMKMVVEVRRQFRTIPGLMEGKAKPDTKRCIEISTAAGLHEMILPGVLTVVIPIVVGIASVKTLGGVLAGATVSGFLLAVMMANSGGAWDNAKKYIEAGHYGGKGSQAHKNAVVGDTVGDPFKDTSGPSLNILIKLMSIVSLVFLPLFL